ncbi:MULTISPECIES: glycosyltransferase family 4 protein [Pseudescherichia]|uniref:glycosyltransferase family 4 protein n=1 Tax=Pseudescherichia TaxID=2055880 RepID=UPI00215063CC|nr:MULTISPECIES: glycosyltransferase family 4 protein [unclassified Pseudescherichia]MCR4459408.1 glycosyltransferase family 4 protein [Pseudescherichia sp. L3]
MIVAFCLYKYFPFGGLQRDFMRIAQTVAGRGHQVRVYTQSWQGECPAEFELIVVPVRKRTNHGRNAEYYQWVKAHLAQHPAARVVGFNKMPDLDIYYAADVCYAEKVAQEKGFFYRLTSRYRHYAAFERATFEQGKKTQLLMLTDKQIADFQRHYHTEPERFHILPPGIYPDRKYSQQIPDSRRVYREKNRIGEDQNFVLQVGSDFNRKGVARTIEAIAALPDALRQNTLLFIVGQDKPGHFAALAAKLGIKENVHFFAGRSDVAELMAAADLLVHPAKQEAAGIVLLEAVAAGLPVIVTEVCGYAPYITDARCGVVINEPFSQAALNKTLADALGTPSRLREWAANARHYADTQDLYSLPEKVADMITGKVNG